MPFCGSGQQNTVFVPEALQQRLRMDGNIGNPSPISAGATPCNFRPEKVSDKSPGVV
ncbi:MAG: hypothetical protein ACE5I1_31590 [bacterium]